MALPIAEPAALPASRLVSDASRVEPPGYWGVGRSVSAGRAGIVSSMQQRPLGRSGLAVSRLALGTMTWGRDTDADDAAAQLKTFRDAGGTLIDTADVYGDGDAESVHRHACSTRWSPATSWSSRPRRGCGPGMTRRRDGSRAHLLRALDASLRRLGTDHVDLWQVHGYDTDTPARGDAGRAGHRGHQRPGPLRGHLQLHRLADRPRPPPGSRPGRAGPRWSPPRWSTRCWSAAWSARCCPPARRSGWACCPGRRSAAGCSPASTGTACRPTRAAASPHFERFVGPYLDDPARRDRGGGRDGRRGAGRVAAGGGAGLGPGPAGRGRADPRRPYGRPAARRAAGRGHRRCRPRSGRRWTTSRRSAAATRSGKPDLRPWSKRRGAEAISETMDYEYAPMRLPANVDRMTATRS